MLSWLAIAFLGVAGVAHFGSIGIVIYRIRRKPHRIAFDDGAPRVSIVRPVCGDENKLDACLASGFRLTYPNYELLLCADDGNDTALPLVEALMQQHPDVDARIVIGRDRIGANPKLNNVVKGFRDANSDWIIMSDSNAILPPDFVEQLLSCWREDTGVVSTATIVDQAETFGAELECAFMNMLQARWVLAADSVGYSFALGKSLMYRRDILDSVGGLPKLAEWAAEDIATTHAMRTAGYGIRLARDPVRQPVGRRSIRQVVNRQIRWAKLRRAGFRGLYGVEAMHGGAVPMLVLAALAIGGAVPVGAATALVAAWYGAEMVLPAVVGWPTSRRTLATILARDALLPVIWIAGLFGNSFEWRGNLMSVARPELADASAFETEQS